MEKQSSTVAPRRKQTRDRQLWKTVVSRIVEVAGRATASWTGDCLGRVIEAKSKVVRQKGGEAFPMAKGRAQQKDPGRPLVCLV